MKMTIQKGTQVLKQLKNETQPNHILKLIYNVY